MARDDTPELLAAALAAKALQTAREALARAPVPGPQGERGEPGQPGRDGADGKDGADGRDGKDGEQGPPGRDGADGAPSRDGRDGADGERGPQGEQGPPGRDGIDGLDGRDGAPGRRGVDGRDGRDAMTLAPARVTFERDERQRTRRMLVLPLAGTQGLEVLPVRDARTGLMVAADIGLYLPAAA
jgi:hypothetical protein